MENLSLFYIVLLSVVVPFVVSVAATPFGSRFDRWLSHKSEERERKDLELFATLEERGVLTIFIIQKAVSLASRLLFVFLTQFLGFFVGIGIGYGISVIVERGLVELPPPFLGVGHHPFLGRDGPVHLL